MNLAHKVALVTGGARGLGRGFTEALLDRGANVCIADIQVDLGLDTARNLQGKYGLGRIMFVACDVTKNQEMEDLFNHVKSMYGRLDIVVNNAGIGGEDRWEKMVDINLTAVIRGTLMAIQHMATDNGGNGGIILNMGSTSGLTAVPFIPAYAGTKHGVVGFSRSIAGEVGDRGIRVVCLCPSFTETEMFADGQESRAADLSGSSDAVRNSPASVGIMKMPEVVKAFIRLVDDTHNNGGVMAVTPRGMDYRFPRSIKGKL